MKVRNQLLYGTAFSLILLNSAAEAVPSSQLPAPVASSGNYGTVKLGSGINCLNGILTASCIGAGGGGGGGSGLPAVTPTSVSVVSGTTISGSALASGSVVRSGPTATFSDSTDTAANIITALATLTGSAVTAGQQIPLTISNTTAYPETILAGTGVTLTTPVVINAGTTWTFQLVVNSNLTSITMNASGGSSAGVTPGACLQLNNGVLSGTQGIDKQTATTYNGTGASLPSSLNCMVSTSNNTSAVSWTLPPANTAGYTQGWSWAAQNNAAGLLTINASPSVFLGPNTTTITIRQNTGCAFVSDGTNYQPFNCSAIGATGISLSSTSGANTITGTGSSILTVDPVFGNTANTYTQGGTACILTGGTLCTLTGQLILEGGSTAAPGLSGPTSTVGINIGSDIRFINGGTYRLDINGTQFIWGAANVLKSHTYNLTGTPVVAGTSFGVDGLNGQLTNGVQVSAFNTAPAYGGSYICDHSKGNGINVMTASIAGDNMCVISFGAVDTAASSFFEGAAIRSDVVGTVSTGVVQGNITLATSNTSGVRTDAFQIDGSQQVHFLSANSFSANGSVATSLGSVGPTGSHVAVQKWLTFYDNTGAAIYVPGF